MPTGMPVQIDPAVGLLLQFDQRRAVDRMHHDALPAIGDADDSLAWQRLATGAPRRRLVGGETEHGAVLLDLLAITRRQFRIERGDDIAGGKLSGAEARQKIIRILNAELLRRRAQRLGRRFLADMVEGHARQFGAELDVALAVLLAQ